MSSEWLVGWFPKRRERCFFIICSIFWRINLNIHTGLHRPNLQYLCAFTRWLNGDARHSIKERHFGIFFAIECALFQQLSSSPPHVAADPFSMHITHNSETGRCRFWWVVDDLSSILQHWPRPWESSQRQRRMMVHGLNNNTATRIADRRSRTLMVTE